MVWFTVLAVIILLFGLVVLFGAPYVPSQRRYLKRLFDHIGLGQDDVLVDLGSGDGLVLRMAARRYSARAIGYELNPLLVMVARLMSLHDKNVTVKLANAWHSRFPEDVTVVYIFAVGRDEGRLVRTVRREATRLGRSLKLVCLGNPLRTVKAKETFDAYSIYSIAPSHTKKLTV